MTIKGGKEGDLVTGHVGAFTDNLEIEVIGKGEQSFFKCHAKRITEKGKFGNLNLIFSNTEPTKEKGEERVQLSQSHGDEVSLVVGINDIISDKYYVIVSSTYASEVEVTCRYSAYFDVYPNFHFNFMTTKKTKKLEIMFQFFNSDDQSKEDLDFDVFMIWSKSTNQTSLSLEGISPNLVHHYHKFNRNILYFYRNDIFDMTKIYSVFEAVSDNDFIQLGASTFKIKDNRLVSEQKIRPDGSEYFGFINEDLEPKDICYQIEPLKTTKEQSDSYVFITGTIFTNVADIYYYKPETKEEGQIYHRTTGYILNTLEYATATKIYFCIKKPQDDKIKQVAYSILATDYSEAKLQTLNTPFQYSEIKTKILKKGEIGAYYGMPSPSESKIKMFVKALSGFPDMYIDICHTFPFCTYVEKKEQKKNLYDRSLDEVSNNPHNTNRMSHFDLKYEVDTNKSPINQHQNVIVVFCSDGNLGNKTDESISGEEYCRFQVGFSSTIDTIKLIENQLFSHFLLPEDEDKFRIDYSNLYPYKIFIDLIIHSGDLDLKLNADDNIHRYIANNKIFYSIAVNSTEGNKNFTFKVKAIHNSYYSIKYNLVYKNDSSININNLETGMDYLITIDPNPEKITPDILTKTVIFNNLKSYNFQPFISSFKSVNCEVSIERINNENKSTKYKLKQDDSFYQDIVKYEEGKIDYFVPYEYKITISNTDSSSYEHKLCMIYASGYEQEKSGESLRIERQILVSENVPQRFKFNNDFKSVKLLYPHSDPTKNLLFNLNFIDNNIYEVKYYFEYHTGENEIITNTYYNSDSITVSNFIQQIACTFQTTNICNIILEITSKNPNPNQEPRLEVTIKTSLSPIPTYLPKNRLSYGFLSGKSWDYYFADIGEKEQGDILLDVNRGSAKIYGRIVNINLDKPEKDANWRGLYKLPTNITSNETIFFNGYEKKLMFFGYQTEKCKTGCYLLLGIQSSIEGTLANGTRSLEYSITFSESRSERSYQDIVPIIIPTDQFVFGDIGFSQDERIYQFYRIIFNKDSDEVQFDLQSYDADLYIVVEGQGADQQYHPTTINYDFAFKSQFKSSIFSLKKDQIIKAANKHHIETKDSIKGLGLIIGIWVGQNDGISGSMYALKITLPSKELPIYEVKSDQKVQCKPKQNGNKYRCLFILIEREFDTLFNTTLYPKSIDESVDLNMYVKWVYKKDYLENQLENQIPKSGSSDYSTDKSQSNYIIIPNLDNIASNRTLFISVESDKDSYIEFLSSFRTYESKLVPNPSTTQLFYVKDKEFILEFGYSNDIMIQIVSVFGQAQVYWEKEKDIIYDLSGRDDRLLLTNHVNNRDKTKMHSNLIIKNLNYKPSTQLNSNNEENAILFYMTYYPRHFERNFDEIPFGKSYNVAYREGDLPVRFYSRINDFKEDIHMFISFYEMIDNSGHNYKFIEDTPYDIAGVLTKVDTIYQSKQDPSISISTEDGVLGDYDSGLKVAYISFDKRYLNSTGFTANDNTALYVEVTKNLIGEKSRNYQRMNMEVTFIQENSKIPLTEKVYQFGKLHTNDKEEVDLYLLMNNKSKKKMKIEFSMNSGAITYTINKDPEKQENLTSIKSHWQNGRGIISFDTDNNADYYYLRVFGNKGQSDVEAYNNYVIKYINYNDDSEIKDFKVVNTNLQITEEKFTKSPNKTYTISFDPVVNDYKQVNVIYIVKFISYRSAFLRENFDNIALTHSFHLSKEFYNPKISNGKITVKVYDVRMNTKFVQVIAQIKDKTINEYISYSSAKNDTFKIKISDDGSKKGSDAKKSGVPFFVIIIIAVVALIAIVVLVIVLIRCNSKNQDLLKKVQQTSFQQSGTPEEAGDGLLMNQDNNLA